MQKEPSFSAPNHAMSKSSSVLGSMAKYGAIGFFSIFLVSTALGWMAGAQPGATGEPEAVGAIEDGPAAPADDDNAPSGELAAATVVAEAPAAATPAAEEPAADEPAAEEPAAEEPAAEEPVVDEPVDEAPVEGAPSSALDIEETDTPLGARLISFLGIFGLIGIAWLISTDRRAVDWKLVAMGTGIQLVFALFILKTAFGKAIFDVAGDAFTRLLSFTEAGNRMIFTSFVDGQIHGALINFAFAILPTIIFFSSLMTVMYHLGVMQRVVNGMAWLMQKTMGTSGSETLSAAGNIFVGQTEAPLMVKPFVATMTMSELMAIMTGGFATVAGGVMGAYVGFLAPYFPDIAGHLMAASVMSAPAALVIAKVMYPEKEESPTKGAVKVAIEKIDANLVDAAARGASEGLMLAFNVAAMLLAFVALVAMVNYMMAFPSYIQHGMALADLVDGIRASGGTIPAEIAAVCDPTQVAVGPEARAGCIADIQAAVASAPEVRVLGIYDLEFFFGWIFAPIAFLMGTPLADCRAVGNLLGQKMVINEFVAYMSLSAMMSDATTALQPRSALIATYALCGFANFGSIGIQIGGISGMAPERRSDLAKLGMRAMIGGSIAAFMTATIAGILV